MQSWDLGHHACASTQRDGQRWRPRGRHHCHHHEEGVPDDSSCRQPNLRRSPLKAPTSPREFRVPPATAIAVAAVSP